MQKTSKPLTISLAISLLILGGCGTTPAPVDTYRQATYAAFPAPPFPLDEIICERRKFDVNSWWCVNADEDDRDHPDCDFSFLEWRGEARDAARAHCADAARQQRK